VIRFLRWDLLTVAFYRALIIGFSYAQPFLITQAVKYLSDPETPERKNVGYGLVIDVDSFTQSVKSFNDVWASTIEVAVAIWLLQRQLGAICLVPLAMVAGTCYF